MLTSNIERFSGYYCSGCFVSDSSTLTALSLLFEELYIPNNLELAIEFAKKYKFINLSSNIISKAQNLTLKPHDKFQSNDPLEGLSAEQQSVVFQYYTLVTEFFITNRDLIGNFIKTDLFSNNEPLDAKLIKEGKNGELNTYQVSIKPLIVTLSDEDDCTKANNDTSGSFPVLGNINSAFSQKTLSKFDINARSLACVLAMRSLSLVLPSTMPASAEDILEARHKLKDHLPPFWSAMLKLSTELKKRITTEVTFDELLFEGNELVQTVVWPSLIELKEKIRLEEKNKFLKIISPIANCVKVLIGNPQLDLNGLMRAGFYSGVEILDNMMSQGRNIEMLKHSNGLAFLLETDKHFAR